MSIADHDFRSYLEKIPDWHAPHASLVSKKQGKSNASGSFFPEVPSEEVFSYSVNKVKKRQITELLRVFIVTPLYAVCDAPWPMLTSIAASDCFHGNENLAFSLA
jgi:hypothetical protein